MVKIILKLNNIYKSSEEFRIRNVAEPSLIIRSIKLYRARFLFDRYFIHLIGSFFKYVQSMKKKLGFEISNDIVQHFHSF